MSIILDLKDKSSIKDGTTTKQVEVRVKGHIRELNIYDKQCLEERFKWIIEKLSEPK